MGVAGNDELDTELDEGTETEEGESQDEAGEGDGDTEESEGAEGGGTGSDEEEVGFGSEEPPASEEEKAAPQWIKDLRQRQRELARENADLKARIGAGQPGQPNAKPTLPPKPKLADYEFDEERYEAARDAWEAKKREEDSWEENQRKATEAQQHAARAVEEQYAKDKAALKVKDYQEREDTVADALEPIQQAIMKKGAGNAALLVAALGRDPKKLQELASIKDPVKFAVAVGKLETEVKVTKRTSTKPAPEGSVRSGSSGASTAGSKATLERLEAEAERTGDRTKLITYKRQLKQTGKK